MRSIAILFFLLLSLIFLCLTFPKLASAVTPMAAAGNAHTVALKSDGTVEAWGDNSYGQLGTGNLTGHLTPVKVLTGVMAVAAGDTHSVALKSDGTVWVWGDNSYYQLGDGTQTGRPKPKAVKGLTDVIAVAAGMGHTVALKSDHTVMVWGSNPDGELGDGTMNDSYTPIAVPGLTGVVAISVGPSGYHTVALKSDGTVVAWGYNKYGQVGDGTTDNNSLVPLAVPGLTGVIAVAAGNSHSVALKSDGTVVAWGSNLSGQLGDGTTTDSLIPVAVVGLSGVTAVAAGDAHTVALKSDGTVWVWGYNGDGELGDGTTTDRSSPVAVPGLNGVVAVAAGDYHTDAVKSDGTVAGWGYNLDGELGDGTITNRLSPVEAYGLISAVACNMTSAVNMVNTCVPEVKLYVAGSSALGGALATVIPADLFDTTTTPVISVLDNGSANGNAGANAVSAWYGMSKPGLTGGASKRLFVVYNNNNGSAAGVSQLLVTENPAKTALIPEADIVTIGPAMTIAHNYAADSCTVDSGSTILAPVVACTSHGATQADMAISDVNVTELYQLETPSTGKLSALTTLTTTPLALQGFGVAVNSNLYAALQTANLAEGLIPYTCTAGDLTAACQPTIRRADYTSLITKNVSIKSAAALLNNPSDTTVLTLARGNDLSGTLAASNIFFADNPCGRDHDSKGKLIKGVVGGMLDIVSTTDSTANLVIQANATANDVVTALNATGGYALGVLGLNGIEPARTATSWKYVAIDGVSPNFDADGSTDAYQRNAFISGTYPFAMMYFAVTPVKPAKTSTVTTTGYTVISTLINGLKDSTLHDLTGVGYLDGAANAKQSMVHRTNGNNCSPLIR